MRHKISIIFKNDNVLNPVKESHVWNPGISLFIAGHFVLSCICNTMHSLTLSTSIRSFVLKLTRGFKSSNSPSPIRAVKNRLLCRFLAQQAFTFPYYTCSYLHRSIKHTTVHSMRLLKRTILGYRVCNATWTQVEAIIIS